MLGGLRSTRLPPMGPAVTQLPAASQSCWVPVAALAVSTPAGTEVNSWKPAGEVAARPDRESAAVQASETSPACQFPSEAAQLKVGAVRSSWTVSDPCGLVPPAASVAQ